MSALLIVGLVLAGVAWLIVGALVTRLAGKLADEPCPGDLLPFVLLMWPVTLAFIALLLGLYGLWILARGGDA